MRIFAGDRLKSVMTRLNVPEDMPIEQGMITKLLESAQKKMENYHFDTRKHLLEYDDVLNRHRQVIYQKRREILEANANTKEMILDYIEQEIELVVSFHTNPMGESDKTNGWNMKEIVETMKTIFALSPEEVEAILTMGTEGQAKLDQVQAREAIVQYLLDKARREYESVEKQVIASAPDKEKGAALMREVEKGVLLRSIDTLWVDHLVAIDYLRTGIGLRGYGQRDPLIEYKKENLSAFSRTSGKYSKRNCLFVFQNRPWVSTRPTIMANDKLTLSGAEKEMSSGEKGQTT